MARRRTSDEFAPLQSSPLSSPRPFFTTDPQRASPSESDSEKPLPRRPRTNRRSAVVSASYAPIAPTTPTSPSFARRDTANPFEHADSTHHDAGAGAEDNELSPTWNATNLYYQDRDADEPVYHSPGRGSGSYRSLHPPSSFQYPFQSHPGNPDPLPSVRRRSASLESLTSSAQHGQQRLMSASDESHSDPPLHPPNASFMARRASSSSLNLMTSNSSIYRSSAAAGLVSPQSPYATGAPGSPHAAGPSSAPGTPPPPATFRAPFLSPASRPSSSIWTPPTHSYASAANAASSSVLQLPAPPAPAPSTRLPAKLSKEEKPWLQRAAPRQRISWWLTFACMLAGLAGAALLCFFGIRGVDKFSDSQLCLVMEDDFDTFDLTNKWTREVQLGGFGNGEFQIASSFDNNSYVQNGNLYIMPTLTSDWLGQSQVETGNLTMDPCTEALTNKTACMASGDISHSRVINPVMTARINTKDHYSITYGRVEVRAKLPRGDWLWPAIWMLPVNGTWPLDGEMDIMEARGNSPAYSQQGSNFVRATVQYGPFSALVTRAFGWYGLKRTSFDQGFHTYGLDWDDTWMRFYVDSQVHQMLYIQTKNQKESFWNRAGFPDVAHNGSSEVVVQNPYQHINSPFDQPFYLIIDLAVGGTSGWFPDKVGGKPWLDGSLTAMYDFYRTKNQWYPTWPKDPADGAFRIDSVKMWKKC